MSLAAQTGTCADHGRYLARLDEVALSVTSLSVSRPPSERSDQ
jgi:hypothetical protein